MHDCSNMYSSRKDSIIYCFLHAVIPQVSSSQNKYRTCEGQVVYSVYENSFLLLAIMHSQTAGYQFHTLGFPVLGTNKK